LSEPNHEADTDEDLAVPPEDLLTVGVTAEAEQEPPSPPPPRAARGRLFGEKPDLPSIASIREGLPRTMERLLQIPIAEEVAQNSYKSRSQSWESREELIHRLFDPPMTLEDTARLLGVCPTTVRRYTNRGLLQHHRTQGNQRRFRLSDLLAFLERWGDAGPEAGSLGGSVTPLRSRSGGSRTSRARARAGEEHTDAEQSATDAADADTGGPDTG
jgi:excisionase family DNA binding protein